MKNEDIITVDELLNNLPIYQELIKHINVLDSSVRVRIGAAYLRVSSDMQTEYSPEAQLEDIIKYCIMENIMLPKENIYLEPGISGRRADKRAEFQKMIAKAELKEEQLDIILVHKYDRFARNREDSIVYKSKLRKKLKIDIVAVKELLPEDKKLAMMMESQLETWGEYYSMNLSDEVKKGLRKKANRGEHIGKPAFGYIKVVRDVIRVQGKEKIIRDMIIKEDEAKVVKEIIFEGFAIRKETLRFVTQKLNSLGIKTKNGNEWNDRAVVWILNNPVYNGYNRWTDGGMNRDWNHPDTISKKSKNIPIIIDDELWNLTQERLKELDLIYGKKRKQTPKHEHWLRGLIRCDNCNSLIVKNGKAFQCTGYTHARCNVSHSITVKAVEEAIIEELRNNFTNKPISIEISQSSYKNDDEVSILKNQLTQIELKEKRIKAAYENGIDSLEEYSENKKRLSNDKNCIVSKIEKLGKTKNEVMVREDVFKRCKDAYDILLDPEVSDEDKSIITHKLFEKIVFVKSEHKLVISYK